MIPQSRLQVWTTALCALTYLPSSLALSSRYLSCQLQKPDGTSALEGCPDGTLYVSATDSEANFTAVQDAVLSLYVVEHFARAL